MLLGPFDTQEEATLSCQNNMLCETVSTSLHVTFGNGFSFNITYQTGSQRWYGAVGNDFSCAGDGGALTLNCSSGSWQIGGVASMSSPLQQSVTPSSLSPFFLDVEADDALCFTPLHVTITEV